MHFFFKEVGCNEYSGHRFAVEKHKCMILVFDWQQPDPAVQTPEPFVDVILLALASKCRLHV